MKIAIEVIPSFLHVAIILHAISPRFAIKILLIAGLPKLSFSWSNVVIGSFSASVIASIFTDQDEI